MFLTYLFKFLFFFLQGPSAACAHENIKDLSSYERMKEGGWDLELIDEKERLVLPGETCEKKLAYVNTFKWILQKWTEAMISTTFWGSGRVTLKFDNCYNEGDVTVLADGTEIAKSKSVGGETTATFNVEEGTVLEIKANSRAIIRLKDLQIECGKHLFLGLSKYLVTQKVLIYLEFEIHSMFYRCFCNNY